MVDIVSPEKRSKMMSGIRSKNTKPELLIRQALHKNGFRFRLHQANLPGKPDLVLARYNAVIFIHGCFWHGHDCSVFKWPASNKSFWKIKINKNIKRDQEVLTKFKNKSQRVLVIWECSIRRKKSFNSNKVMNKIISWLRSNKKYTVLE